MTNELHDAKALEVPPTDRQRLLTGLRGAEPQSAAARTVELYGWILLLEAAFLMIGPGFMSTLFDMPVPAAQADAYLRLAGVLLCALGVLYVVGGRVNALGLAFASLFERAIVPVLLLVLWYAAGFSGALAAALGIQSLLGAAWTLKAWCSAPATQY